MIGVDLMSTAVAFRPRVCWQLHPVLMNSACADGMAAIMPSIQGGSHRPSRAIDGIVVWTERLSSGPEPRTAQSLALPSPPPALAAVSRLTRAPIMPPTRPGPAQAAPSLLALPPEVLLHILAAVPQAYRWVRQNQL